MTIMECREAWEKGLVYIAGRQRDDWTVLAVLKDRRGSYHCHRYCKIGENWDVSVDAAGVDAETAILWTMNPKAIPVEREEEIEV